jgi:hypothetical protein
MTKKRKFFIGLLLAIFLAISTVTVAFANENHHEVEYLTIWNDGQSYPVFGLEFHSTYTENEWNWEKCNNSWYVKDYIYAGYWLTDYVTPFCSTPGQGVWTKYGTRAYGSWVITYWGEPVGYVECQAMWDMYYGDWWKQYQFCEYEYY